MRTLALTALLLGAAIAASQEFNFAGASWSKGRATLRASRGSLKAPVPVRFEEIPILTATRAEVGFLEETDLQYELGVDPEAVIGQGFNLSIKDWRGDPDAIAAAMMPEDGTDEDLVPLEAEVIENTLNINLPPWAFAALNKKETSKIRIFTANKKASSKLRVIAQMYEMVREEEVAGFEPQQAIWRPITDAQIKELRGKVAVLIHGIFSDKEEMVNAARVLAGLDFYDRILVYAYPWQNSILSNGDAFALRLANVDDTVKVDVFAHSMGGLVTRQALRRDGGKHGIGALMTLGTPHRGVPIPARLLPSVFKVTKSQAPGITDLVAGSKIITELNSVVMPAKFPRFVYIGRRHDNYSFGRVVGLLPSYWGTAFDGIVPVASAEWSLTGNRRRVVEFNHGELNGDDLRSEQALGEAIGFWLRERGLR
jgi:pimeloyl-ACP methyl ester carboxylesterase